MSAPRMPVAGARIGGKYELKNVIGQGGFATVFEAVDVTLGRDVAVKILNPGSDGYEVTLAQRFKREAQLVSSLCDPHTIQMFDYGRSDEGLLYMVFELLDGEDLSTRLQRDGAMSPAEVEHVVRQVLDSLREAHAHGLLHRDIKPGNIRLFRYMDDPLCAKLMDFGIARDAAGAGRVTKTGAIVGTPRYMSPEQFTGEQLTPASDLFGLGLVALEMLTGQPAPRQDIILGKGVRVPVDGPLGDLIDAMLCAEAGHRIQSGDEALAILDGLEDVEVTTKMDARPERGPQQPDAQTHKSSEARDRRDLVAPLVIGLAGLIAAGVLIARTTDDEPPSRVVVPGSAAPQSRSVSDPVAKTPVADTSVAQEAAEADIGTSEPVVSGCGRAAPVESEATAELEVMVGLERRGYRRLLPGDYDPNKKYGVLIAFHNTGVGPLELKRAAGLGIDGRTEHDAIVAMPLEDGLIAWEGLEALELGRQIVADLKRSYCVDDDRVYVLGDGKGGVPAERLSCEPWVTAFATMGYRKWRVASPCAPAGPKPYLHLAPTRSGHLPLEGGKDCLWESTMISLRAHDQHWRERNGCRGESTVEEYRGSKCFTWACDAPYESCHLDGGLTWPGREPRAIDVLRCDGDPADFPVSQRMWSFFDRATAWRRANASAVR